MEEIKNEYFYNGITALPKDATVTMAYVPFQLDTTEFDLKTALKKGTLFVVLDKPYTGVPEV
jgi:hypothetical protein